MFLSLDITKNQKSDICSSWCIYSHTEFTFIVSKEVCLWDNKWVLKGNRIWLIRTQHAHTYRHMKVSTDWVLCIYNSGVTCGDTFINRCSHLSNQSFPNKKKLLLLQLLTVLNVGENVESTVKYLRAKLGPSQTLWLLEKWWAL